MKKETIQFIIKLLEKELESEIIQNNPNPKEVVYVQDLIKSSSDFAKNYGDWCDVYNINNLITELKGE